MRVEVRPAMLRWARERSGLALEGLKRRFPKLEAWEAGKASPTLKQLEAFASATHTPVGYLFLAAPPIETVPIPDFRTLADQGVGSPSPGLLDTVYVCQQRQEWYRDFSRAEGAAPLDFVASATVDDDIVDVAARMRDRLGFDLDERRAMPTWGDALRQFIAQADSLGVLVMVNGVVGNNNRRKLRPEEFRGFALVDSLAPLVFINGADTKSAQMFTVAHELAHIWLGQSALSDASLVDQPRQRPERWCNQVAAELLVPLDRLRSEYRRGDDLQLVVHRLARTFKVSTLVVLRRLHDLGALGRDEMWSAYREELERLGAVTKSPGGDFYLTQAARVSRRFARALVSSTFEGQTLYRDAFRLLGFSKLETFRELARNLGAA